MLRTLLLLGFLAAVGITVFKWATSDRDPGSNIVKRPAQDNNDTGEERGPSEEQTPTTVTRTDPPVVSGLDPLRHRDQPEIPNARLLMGYYPEQGDQRNSQSPLLGT